MKKDKIAKEISQYLQQIDRLKLSDDNEQKRYANQILGRVDELLALYPDNSDILELKLVIAKLNKNEKEIDFYANRFITVLEEEDSKQQKFDLLKNFIYIALCVLLFVI